MCTSSRLYHCCHCHAQVIICSHCDHGQRYCPGQCRHQARSESLKRAAIKYQFSRAGRFNNAVRQQRFRQRLRQKVTHHGSLQTSTHAVLANKPSSDEKHPWQAPMQCTLYCHFCGTPCGPFLRHDFSQRSRFEQRFRYH